MRTTTKVFSVASIILAIAIILLIIGCIIYTANSLINLDQSVSEIDNSNNNDFYVALFLGSFLSFVYYGSIFAIIILLFTLLVAIGGLVISIKVFKKLDVSNCISSLILAVTTLNPFLLVTGILGLISLKKEKKQEVKLA